MTAGITVRPLTAEVGAEIAGVDLTAALDVEAVGTVRRALLDHGVVFFRDQPMSGVRQIAFAERFAPVMLPVIDQPGEVRGITVLDQVEPKGKVNNDRYHADSTFLAEPPLGAVLQAVQLPRVGGDTYWASMYGAYELLSLSMQRFVDGLSALHSTEKIDRVLRTRAEIVRRDSAMAPSVHPVVRVHPETGRKALYVNRNYTVRIVELSDAESDALLDMLFEHIGLPELSVRFHWEPGSVAFWDNRCTQHCALSDYHERRVMWRCLLQGDRPVGPSTAA